MSLDMEKWQNFEPGTLIKCKSQENRFVIAMVLGYDDEHPNIVHIAIFVYGEGNETYSIGFAPIEHDKLVESGYETFVDDRFGMNKDLYEFEMARWSEGGAKSCFTIPVQQIVQQAEQSSGVQWGVRWGSMWPV